MKPSHHSRVLSSLASAVVLAVPLSLSAPPADAASYHYSTCSAMHKDFKHGVGKSGARDKVRGKTKPVTTFKRSTKIYKAAVKYNPDLDRDRDGVACEKR